MLAAIFGVSGQVLTSEERAFFRDVQPFGFILFARNVADPDQMRRLVNDLRASVEHAEAPVLIDQEGGRVQRLKPPHWRAASAAAKFGALASQRASDGRKAVFLNHQLIGAELAALGIDVDCAPLLDVQQPGAHDVIGDRAYRQRSGAGRDPRPRCSRWIDVGRHHPGHQAYSRPRPLDGRQPSRPAARDRRRTRSCRRTDFVPFKRLQGSALGHDGAHRL